VSAARTAVAPGRGGRSAGASAVAVVAMLAGVAATIARRRGDGRTLRARRSRGGMRQGRDLGSVPVSRALRVRAALRGRMRTAALTGLAAPVARDRGNLRALRHSRRRRRAGGRRDHRSVRCGRLRVRLRRRAGRHAERVQDAARSRRGGCG